ncbi:MAG TPA: biotin carboxylase N-terminal domain-containing protein [Candidatus Saccharimonadales bacterium]|jgi:propionyl-CoA carboxylase alpha chain|nr:biotin carboxylase N-terminal domain-containing protein [Candidatus Saccharimonadales bacterium]
MRRILIANRGEIALRILRTCRAMGLETVAVYSDFDRDALHVRMADQAVPIGPAPPRVSYLKIEAILEAARLSGADAIHPGYGFLAENAEFAEACEQAGVIFIGPKSGVIRAMGSKVEARKLAEAAGVPVVPAVAEDGPAQAEEDVLLEDFSLDDFPLEDLDGIDSSRKAIAPSRKDENAFQRDTGVKSLSSKDVATLGYPLLIKASAGGGGRGMRIVRGADEFGEAYAAARGEAERAFGDGRLLVEKYVEGARHVEVQIFGDHHGQLMHLFERDCSVQRRHQKIIEESPSPLVTHEIRQRMAEAAVALGRKIGYTNAGTVEFLLAPSGEFYFIEVNTRIQVEHPVTEMVTGLDLIRMQIEIAQGQRLPSEPARQAGHAIEARLYAEVPENNFLPATGTLHVWQPPAGIDGVRIDSGVEPGTEIGVHYDPLLAKIIAHGPDRATAIHKLVYALKNFAAQGVETNREFLIDVLEHEEFRAGRAHTGFQLPPQTRGVDGALPAAITRAYIEEMERGQRPVLTRVPVRYRNNPYPGPAMRLEIGNHECLAASPQPGVDILRVGPGLVEALVDGVRTPFHIHQHGDAYYLRANGMQRTVTRLPRYPQRVGAGQHQTANSPMPGLVLRVLVSPGDKVKLGDPLITMEAMKMEQTIKAAMDGVVVTILVKPGQIVAPGQTLVEIESKEDAHEHADSPTTNR